DHPRRRAPGPVPDPGRGAGGPAAGGGRDAKGGPERPAAGARLAPAGHPADPAGRPEGRPADGRQGRQGAEVAAAAGPEADRRPGPAAGPDRPRHLDRPDPAGGRGRGGRDAAPAGDPGVEVPTEMTTVFVYEDVTTSGAGWRRRRRGSWATSRATCRWW